MDYNVTFREKNGSVQAIVSYKDSFGKWKQKSKQGFKTQKAAKPWIKKTVDKLEEINAYIDPEHNNDTFEIVFKRYIEHAEIYNEANTLINCRPLKIHFKELFDMKINKISSMDIQNCIDDMVRKGLKASTINHYKVKLKTIFYYAITHKIIKENPVSNITLPKDKNANIEKIKALTVEETTNLLSNIKYYKDYKYYLISLVVVTCGFRIGELLALKWSDVDEKNNTITVNKQWKIINSHTNEYGEGLVKRPNSNRIVPVPQSTMDELKKYKSNYPINISGRLFADENNGNLSACIRFHFKSLGYNISIHDLRHTYVCRLIENGLDFQTIAALIGDSIEIVIKIYSHFTKDMMKKAERVVNSIF